MSMTREQALERARARKAELKIERDAERRELHKDFMAWVRHEREMFELMLGIRKEFGIGSGEHDDAQQDWRRTWCEMPRIYTT